MQTEKSEYSHPCIYDKYWSLGFWLQPVICVMFILFLQHKLRQFLKAGGKMRPLWLLAGLAVLNAKVARQIWLKSTSLWAVGDASDNRYQTRPQPFDWCQAVSATAYKQQAMAENMQVGCYCGLFIIGIYMSYSLTACMFCWFIIWVVSSCQVKAYAWYSILFPGVLKPGSGPVPDSQYDVNMCKQKNRITLKMWS